jgi:hypothetical protein
MDPLIVDAVISKTVNGNLTLSGNGTGSVYVADALLLPTTGGTPSPLDYYEDFSASMSFKGPWATNVTTTVRIVRIGKMAVASFGDIMAPGAGATSSALTATSALPGRFWPAATVHGLIAGNDRTFLGQAAITGSYTVDTAGIVSFYANAGNGTFNSAGNPEGVYNSAITWITP